MNPVLRWILLLLAIGFALLLGLGNAVDNSSVILSPLAGVVAHASR